MEAFGSILKRLHVMIGCPRAFDCLKRRWSGETSNSFFFAEYFLSWTHAFGLDSSFWLLRLFLRLIDKWNRTMTTWHLLIQLSIYWCIRVFTANPYYVSYYRLVAMAVHCYTNQITHFPFVARVFQCIVARGFPIGEILSLGTTHQIDPTVILYNEIFGRETMSCAVYFSRAGSATKFTCYGKRVENFFYRILHSQANPDWYPHHNKAYVFYHEMAYPGDFYQWNETHGLRGAFFKTFSCITTNFESIDRLGIIDDEYFRSEMDKIATDDDLEYAAAKLLCTNIDYSFRAITDPFVSRYEVFQHGVSESKAELLCEVYEKLFPESFAESKTPRTLEHLCRCCIRWALFENWKHPDEIEKLPLPSVVIEYLNLRVA